MGVPGSNSRVQIFAQDGAHLLYQWGDPRSTSGNGAEFVAVDRDGNLYGGEPRPRTLQKYVRVRP